MSTALFDSIVTEVYDFESNGDAVKDSAHNLTEVNTPTYGSASPPQGSYYADLDGATDEHFTLSDNADFDVGANDYSCSFYFSFESGSTFDIAEKYVSGDGWTITDYWTGSARALGVVHNNSYSVSTAESGFEPAVGTLYHVVFAYDDAAQQITWWISEVGGTFGDQLNGTTNPITEPPGVNSATMYIGSMNATATLAGRLDEFAWFNGHEVNATEAEEIYDGVGSGGWREAVVSAFNPVPVIQHMKTMRAQ
jgi:hypothetical protein